jgi:hypothetical protein
MLCIASYARDVAAVLPLHAQTTDLVVIISLQADDTSSGLQSVPMHS